MQNFDESLHRAAAVEAEAQERAQRKARPASAEPQQRLRSLLLASKGKIRTIATVGAMLDPQGRPPGVPSAAASRRNSIDVQQQLALGTMSFESQVECSVPCPSSHSHSPTLPVELACWCGHRCQSLMPLRHARCFVFVRFHGC